MSKELFQDIIHAAPVSRGRGILDCHNITFKNADTGEELKDTEWYVNNDGEFVVELSELARATARHHSLGALFGSVMADLDNLQLQKS